MWSDLTLGPSFKVKRGQPILKVLITRLLLIPEVCNVKPTYRKSWVGNLLMWSHFTLDTSFKVKRGQPNLKMLITSGIFSLYVFYYCFYRFALFGDTPPTSNKCISLVFYDSPLFSMLMDHMVNIKQIDSTFSTGAVKFRIKILQPEDKYYFRIFW